MPIPSAITDLSATPAANSPSGGESISLADDYLRTQAAFIRQLYDSLNAATTSAGQMRVNILSQLTFAEAADVLARGRNYDIGAKIQAASDAIYAAGCGVLYFPSGDYKHSATLWIKQGVVWEGDGHGFANPYITSVSRPSGSVLFKSTGANTNGVEIRCDLTYDSGSGYLTDTGKTTRNQDARHCGGIRRMMLWGNRSLTQSPSAHDLNSSGHGLVTRGARNFILEEVGCMFWAGDGWNAGTYDFGTGAIGVNNVVAFKMLCMSNSGNGMYPVIGDSDIVSPNCGYNGLDGIAATFGNSKILGGRTWNNYGNGAYYGSMPNSSVSQVIGLQSYDNDRCGHVVDGNPRSVSLVGCIGRGNGRNSQGTYSAAVDSCNFLVKANAKNWHLVGCDAGAYDQANVLTTKYNYYLDIWNYDGVFEGCHSDGDALVEDTHVSAFGHLNVKRIGAPNNVFDGEDVRSSLTANTLDVGNVHRIAVSSATPLTLDTITYAGKGCPEIVIRNANSGALTVVHNTSKIRLNSGGNVVLAQNQTITIYKIYTSSVWQQKA